MTNKTMKLIAITLMGLGLAFPAVSYAQSTQSLEVSSDASSLPSVENGTIKRFGSLFAPLSRPGHAFRAGAGQFYSKSASYHLKVGIKRFEKGNFDKAESSFEAVLRTGELKKLSYLYLAHINAKQGEKAQEQKYVKAYNSLPETPLPVWRGGRG